LAELIWVGKRSENTDVWLENSPQSFGIYLTQQMFGAWEQWCPTGIGCYLDKFTNLGYIPGYAEFISTARALKAGPALRKLILMEAYLYG
jgi:hypothetical protein